MASTHKLDSRRANGLPTEVVDAGIRGLHHAQSTLDHRGHLTYNEGMRRDVRHVLAGVMSLDYEIVPVGRITPARARPEPETGRERDEFSPGELDFLGEALKRMPRETWPFDEHAGNVLVAKVFGRLNDCSNGDCEHTL